MAKKNKGNRNKGDVAEFLLEQRRERNRTEQLAVETIGKGVAYLVDTLLVPLLPAITAQLQAQTTTDRMRAESEATTAQMRAETERLQVEQKLEEARKSLKDHRRTLKAQRRADRRHEERMDEQLRAVPDNGKGKQARG